MLRVWRRVDADQAADAWASQRSSRSATLPARRRAWPASWTNSARHAVACRRVPCTVLDAHRSRPRSGSTPR
jgi:hypothetical protein